MRPSRDDDSPTSSGFTSISILLFETTHATRRRIDAPNDSRDRSACLAPDQCSPSGGCWERLSQARHGVPCSCAGGRRGLSSGLPPAPAPVPRPSGTPPVRARPLPISPPPAPTPPPPPSPPPCPPRN